MEITEFTDGNTVTNFVAKKSIYKSKEGFLSDCLSEFEYIIEDYLNDSEFEKMKSFTDTTIVEDGIYCRYHRCSQSYFEYSFTQNGYIFCEKDKDAFEVYSIDFNKLLKALRD